MDRGDAPEWRRKQLEYEERKARAKALKLRLTCTICGARPKTLLNCPCGTTQYCSTECQRIDWRDRGHRKACKKIRDERAAEATRAEAPTPPPSPPVYGPAPRSHADEVRARIAAEHEAARLRREANPEPEPQSARFGSRCPICLEKWDVNANHSHLSCCCRRICWSCEEKIGDAPCVLCGSPLPESEADLLAMIRRHVEDEVPEAIKQLGDKYRHGHPLILKNGKKAAKLYKRAVELGNVDAMVCLGTMYRTGEGGFKIDKMKSIQLYRMAADRGSAVGQCNLGVHLSGSCPEESIRLWKLSAGQGYAQSELNLGQAYARGWCVEVDLEEARRLFTRALTRGGVVGDSVREPAKAELARLNL